MNLSSIGFYTLSDERVRRVATTNDPPLSRCELVLSARCNFRCPYCRSVGGRDIEIDKAREIVRSWKDNGLSAVRFSGGEPTLYPHIVPLVEFTHSIGIPRIAISSNGSASWLMYKTLTDAGVNDWSISLDACCAADGDRMAGVSGVWDTIVDNIKRLSQISYTTVGVVLTPDNIERTNEIIEFAASLGVSDIRVIPAAQHDDRLRNIHVSPELMERFPIPAYRVRNIQQGLPVRGLRAKDSPFCGLVLDDMAVMGDKHYPCIIYLREKGEPIGTVGPNMREERLQWHNRHNTHWDPICFANCLDVCVAYNNKVEKYAEGTNTTNKEAT